MTKWDAVWFWIGQAALWSATIYNVTNAVRLGRKRAELDAMLTRARDVMHHYTDAYATVVGFMERWGIEADVPPAPELRH